MVMQTEAFDLTAHEEVDAFRFDPINCPMCDPTEPPNGYVHFEEPRFADSHDAWEAWMGRGNAVLIPMYCESGHKWTLGLGQHKGQTWVFVRARQ